MYLGHSNAKVTNERIKSSADISLRMQGKMAEQVRELAVQVP